MIQNDEPQTGTASEQPETPAVDAEATDTATTAPEAAQAEAVEIEVQDAPTQVPASNLPA